MPATTSTKTHRRWIRARALALGVACVGTLPSSAGAFSARGNRWANQASNPVVYRLHPDGTKDVRDGSALVAIRKAFSTWQSVACSFLQFQEGPWVEPKSVANDGVNKIFWAEGGRDQWADPPATIALTYTFFRTEDRIITDADMRVNGVDWRFTTTMSEAGTGTPAKVDVETVILHEIGHFFGLDHSNDPAAVMYGVNNKPIQRTVTPDDVAGICSLYSNGRTAPNPMPGTTGAPIGSPCRANGDCASSICVQDGALNRAYCSAQCTIQMRGTCPAGYDCTATQSGNLCLPPVVTDELCDPCETGGQCSSGFCTTVPNVNSNRGFCSRPCDPTPGQPAQCPMSYGCSAVLGGMGGACAPTNGVCSPAGKGGQNQPCYGNGACKPGYTCVEYFRNSGLNFCYFACDTRFIGLSCTQGGGTRCSPVANRDNAAVCFSVAEAGQPCIPAICDDTSFCAYDQEQGIGSALCYKKCPTGECGPNAQCMGFGSNIPNLCVPLMGYKYEGQNCAGDNECRSRTCRTFGQYRLCTSPCAVTNPSDCGRGLKCIASNGSNQGLCWPNSLIDPNAPSQDPSRSVTQPFCACDTTKGCDKDCACDPDCGGKGCGCTIAARAESLGAGPDSGSLALGSFLVVSLSFGWIRRRRAGAKRAHHLA